MGAGSVALYRKEIEDFCTTICVLGYDQAEFSLRFLQWPRTAKPVAAADDLVVVRRQRNGVEKAYAVDPSSMWLHSFFDDLDVGVFGTP